VLEPERGEPREEHRPYPPDRGLHAGYLKATERIS